MHYNKDMLRIAQMEEGEKIYHYTTIDALINIVSRACLKNILNCLF